MNIRKKADNLEKNMNKYDLIFHYNIKEYPLLGIGYVAVVSMTCTFSACLKKITDPWNRIQDKYNHIQYKCKIQNCVY